MERDPKAPEIRLYGQSRGECLGYRGPERASLFVKQGRGMAYLRRGMAFDRPRAYRTTETARILALILDEQGVPHVRFEVTTRRTGHPDVNIEGLRTLSLMAFADTYCTDKALRFACNVPQRAGAFRRALRGGLRRLLPGDARDPLVALYPEAPAKSPTRDDPRATPFLNSA